jgi:hypothetical protein
LTPRESRATRGTHLLGQWLRYVRTDPRGQALADLRVWLATTFLGRDLLTAGLPWITFPATRWLGSYLRSSMSVFEWGSGGSTVFFARRVARVVSIEYDPVWSEAVSARLRALGLANTEVRHIPPERGDDGALYRSSAAEFAGMSFRRYVDSVREHSDRGFDVILVDGRARLGCVVTAMTRLRPGGVLLLDNSEREDAAEACARLYGAGWPARHFEGPAPSSIWPAFWRTSAFSPPEPPR